MVTADYRNGMTQRVNRQPHEWAWGMQERQPERVAASYPADQGNSMAALHMNDQVAFSIEAWLQEKYALTQSQCTVDTYREILLSLRAYVQARGFDLDSSASDVASTIQLWASLRAAGSKRAGSVAPSTYNQRIAAVSSFYRWAIAQGLYRESNPTDHLSRASIQKYATARALNPHQVSAKLKNMDRSTPRGLRDYMLLQVALNTGRSARELASLCWGNVQVEGELVTLTFERCKGGKTLYTVLDVQLSKALLSYLYTIYGVPLDALTPATPLWMSFSDRTYGEAIGAQTIADICESHLGVSTVQSLRHTFAFTMEQVGAETGAIQGQLGHESRATTIGYLARLRKTQNAFAPALAKVFGVEDGQ